MTKNPGRKFAMMAEDDRRNQDRERALLDDTTDNRKVERTARREDSSLMTRQYDGAAAADPWENLRRPPLNKWAVNVGATERRISAITGAILTLAALRRPRMRGLLLPLGVGFLWRAITGRCAVNRALGRNSAGGDTASPAASLEHGKGIKIEKSVLVFRPREELYRFWRNFENLPRFMDHLESVTIMDESNSHWVAKGPAGTRIEWDAEIHNEIPNELIAWRTLPGSEVTHAGSVHFEPRLPEPGTDVRVILRYEPPAGKPGAMMASFFGEEPSQQIEDDLRRFKQVMEAGETASSRGRRS